MSIASIPTRPNGSSHSIRTEQRTRAAEKLDLVLKVGLAHQVDTILLESGSDSALVVVMIVVFLVNPAGEHDGHAGSACGIDGEVRSLVGREPAEVKNVSFVLQRQRVVALIEAVVNDRSVVERDLEVELAPADGDVVSFGVRGIDAREAFLAVVMDRVSNRNTEVGRYFDGTRRVDQNRVVALAVSRNLVKCKASVGEIAVSDGGQTALGKQARRSPAHSESPVA